MDKKIARFKHFEDRIYQKIKFEHFSPDDIKEILEQITEIKFTEDKAESFRHINQQGRVSIIRFWITFQNLQKLWIIRQIRHVHCPYIQY